ncbi:MAG: 6-pyruvoyl-tetrahydropterin synthase-related protein [Kiritimatiellia bacterium]
MKKRAIAPLLALILFAPFCSHASSISLNIAPSVEVGTQHARVTINIRNRGTSPAFGVHAKAALQGSDLTESACGTLKAGDEWSTSSRIEQLPSREGTYTIVITVRYRDSAGRPFSALAWIPLNIWEPSIEDPVKASLTSTDIAREGKITLALEHTGRKSSLPAAPLKAAVKLVLPDELECADAARSASVLPGSKTELKFHVRNASALEGSAYRVFAVVDSETGERHESVVTAAVLKIPERQLPFFLRKPFCLTLFLLFVLSSALMQVPSLRRKSLRVLPERAPRILKTAFPFLVFSVLFATLFFFIPPSYLLLDTMTTGGDTPAHNYIAGHLKTQLFQHGRILSWANGWWCGFPAFQYYFPLPYLLIALLSLIVPFNIAFKLVSVSGIFLLPAAAYFSGRIMRMPRPVPTVLAAFTLPFLFDSSHVMWGGNIHSTLAGMIANSVGFPLMLVFMARICRDSEDGVFRLRTALLLAALIASHFFTSLLAVICAAFLPFAYLRRRFVRTAVIVASECLLGALVMSWWLIPLIAKRGLAVDFGYNWDVSLVQHTFASFPGWMVITVFALALIPPAVLFFRRHFFPYTVLLLCMIIVSAFLFTAGYSLSRVFVNVRFWPFIMYSVLCLAAIGTGILLKRLKAPRLAAGAVLMVIIMLCSADSLNLRRFAEWNYEGLESKHGYPVFRELVFPLDGSPGRLANDLHPANESMGSSRAFECVPHLIDKPILEGGIVNSAFGSMFSYYIQGLTSENTAGFPNVVIPATFDFANAAKYLELFNVKHFIARGAAPRAYLARSNAWRPLRRFREWELYELTTHDGGYVFVPNKTPVAVLSDFGTRQWKENALAWMYVPAALDYPFVFIGRSRSNQLPSSIPVLTEAEYRYFLTTLMDNDGSIRTWLLLGPFDLVSETHDEEPPGRLHLDPGTVDPVCGKITSGRQWRRAPLRLPVRPDRFYRRNNGLIYFTNRTTYAFANIFSREHRDGILHYSGDDSLTIWLNGKQITASRITGPGNFKKQPVSLREGRNRLLVKTDQTLGGNFFHLKITGSNDVPLPGISFSTARAKPHSPRDLRQKTHRAVITEENVTDNVIEFTTDSPGSPHIIKCTWYPNWKLRGGGEVYMVTPDFMLVYPRTKHVKLYFGRTASNAFGGALSILALGAAVTGAVLRKRRKTLSNGPETAEVC